MKKHLKILALAIMAVFLVAGSAWALNLNFNQDYWTPTETMSGDDGSAFFVLTVEQASYESDFGLFSVVDDVQNPTSVSKMFEVFSKNNELTDTSTVYFKETGGNWQASLNNLTSFVNFDNQFGFYYGVYTGGSSDSDLDYLWFTDKQFNQYADGTSVDTGIEHVATDWNNIDKVTIYLDDQLGGGDRDWDDMTVVGHDLQPVPEPATVLLMGSGLGLLGLGALRRKKLGKDA